MLPDVSARRAVTFRRTPGQENFTRFNRLRADYTKEALRERSGTRHKKLQRQEIEIYYSFVSKVDMPDSLAVENQDADFAV